MPRAPTDTTAEIHVAILYADVSGSMDVFRMQGDADARRVIGALLEELEQCVFAQKGRVVKTLGDELMCAFPNAGAAAAAAIAMQQHVESEHDRRVAGERELHGDQAQYVAPLSLRVGFHWGPVMPEGKDYFGQAVNLAARVASLSGADRILTTRETRDVLPRPLRANARSFSVTGVKGIEELVEIYEIVWRDATKRAKKKKRKPSALKETRSRLRLVYGGSEQWLEAGQPPLTIGRTIANRFVIDSKYVSGRHAKIELRGGTFVLTDHSSNGTYVAFDGGIEFFETSHELVLRSSGTLWLGCEPDDRDAVRVRFYVD